MTGGLTGTLDVFLVGGQSNAVGEGQSSGSVTVSTGQGWMWDGSTLQPVADPVGTGYATANTGSAWPAFCAAYFAATGRMAVIVAWAHSGAAQAAAAVVNPGNGSWDTTGTLYTAAKNGYNAAVSAIITANPAATVNKAGMLWLQGERDAQAIDAGLIDVTTYKQAFVAMLARFRTDVDAAFRVYVSELGYDASKGDTAGFQAVRLAQNQVCTADALTDMATQLAKTFPTTVPSLANGLHYKQTGYNQIGAAMANYVAGVLSGVAAARTRRRRSRSS
jgi:hypothetical protein